MKLPRFLYYCFDFVLVLPLFDGRPSILMQLGGMLLNRVEPSRCMRAFTGDFAFLQKPFFGLKGWIAVADNPLCLIWLSLRSAARRY